MDGIGNTASKPDRARARATCNVLETSDVTIEKKPSYIYIYIYAFLFIFYESHYVMFDKYFFRKVWINCIRKIISSIN